MNTKHCSQSYLKKRPISKSNKVHPHCYNTKCHGNKSNTKIDKSSPNVKNNDISSFDNINYQSFPVNYNHPLILDYRRRLNLTLSQIGDLKAECIDKEKQKLKLEEQIEKQRKLYASLQSKYEENELKLKEAIYANSHLQKELNNMKEQFMKMNEDTKTMISSIKSTLHNTQISNNQYRSKVKLTHKKILDYIQNMYNSTINNPGMVYISQQLSHIINLTSSLNTGNNCCNNNENSISNQFSDYSDQVYSNCCVSSLSPPLPPFVPSIQPYSSQLPLPSQQSNFQYTNTNIPPTSSQYCIGNPPIIPPQNPQQQQSQQQCYLHSSLSKTQNSLGELKEAIDQTQSQYNPFSQPPPQSLSTPLIDIEEPQECYFTESSPLPPRKIKQIQKKKKASKVFPKCLKDLDGQIAELNKSLRNVSHFLESDS